MHGVRPFSAVQLLSTSSTPCQSGKISRLGADTNLPDSALNYPPPFELLRLSSSKRLGSLKTACLSVEMGKANTQGRNSI